MSDMHEIILEATTQIFKDYCTKELVDTLEEGKWSSELWDTLVQSGLPLIGISESDGGSGGDYKDAFHIMQLAGKYALPVPLGETILVNWLITDYGGVVTGDSVLTYSINDENKLDIEKNNNGYFVNGSIKSVPWARNAENILVLTNINGENVIALLSLDQATVKTNQNLASEPLDDIFFESVNMNGIWMKQVSKEQFINKTTNLVSLSKAAMMSGAMEKVLELSVQYASEREQFGRPLHRFQAVQQHLTKLSGQTVAILTIVNDTIKLFDKNKHQIEFELAITKLRANEAVEEITSLAHQIHGAIGMTHEHSLHQFTRRLWAWREEGGNEKYLTRYLSEKIMKNEESLWSIITGTEVNHNIEK